MRRVFLAGVTPYPGAAWVARQTRNLALHLDEVGLKATPLPRDHDSKLTKRSKPSSARKA